MCSKIDVYSLSINLRTRNGVFILPPANEVGLLALDGYNGQQVFAKGNILL